MRRFLLFILLPVVTGMFLHSDLIACACCADPGIYYRERNNLRSYENSEIKRYTFAGYIDEDWAGSRGWVLINENFLISGAYDGKSSFNFTVTNQKKEFFGKIHFKAEQRVEEFAADYGEDRKGMGVVLYKEFRFDGKIHATGKITKVLGSKSIKAFLVMQGSGNHCLNPGDLNHFIVKFSLKKKNEKIPFHFVGDLHYKAK